MTGVLPGRAWPEADRLFRSDPYWVGGDGSNSIPLGDDRVIWIHADTFIAAKPGTGRTSDATMINNSVGVQEGLDPSRATMHFHWRSRPDGRPAAFFEEPGPGYLWPCNGAILDGRLLLFAMRVRTRQMSTQERATQPALASFEVYDWVAILVENPTEDPDGWRLRYLDHADSRFATTIGAGSLLVEGDYLYAHATARGQRQYLARWPVDQASAGQLSLPQWWCGNDRGWLPEPQCDQPPEPTVAEPQVEFTVHRDEATGSLIWVQTLGIVEADIAVRTADRPQGPWSQFRPVFHPPEGDADGGIVYGAKTHPEQHGAGDDLVLTYNNNSVRVTPLFEQPHLYYPTFVRVPRSIIPM